VKTTETSPNTWRLRPMLQREDSPCQPGAVHTWPIASFRSRAAIKSLLERSGHQLGAKTGPFGRGCPNAHLGEPLKTAPDLTLGLLKCASLNRSMVGPWSLGEAMRRREFIALVGGAAASWPLAARAQQPERMRRIGVLMLYPEDDSEGQLRATAFQQGLQKLGWSVGRNIQIDFQWGFGNADWI